MRRHFSLNFISASSLTPVLVPVLASVCLLTSACTSTPQRSETRCAGVDWWEMGRTDGVAGLDLDKGLSEHRAQCQGSAYPVDLELYENGRDAGLVDYCSPQQGLASGHAGSAYEHVCPSYLEAPFLAQYSIGKRLYELESEDHDLEDRIENLVALLAKSNSGSALRAQIEDLRARRSNLDLEIARLESTSSGAPSPDSLDPLLAKTPNRLPSSVPAPAPTQKTSLAEPSPTGKIEKPKSQL